MKITTGESLRKAREELEKKLLQQSEELSMLKEQLMHEDNELKQAEERFRGVLESAPDAMVITDKDSIIKFINKQTEKLFGYEREELLGEKVEKLMPQRFRITHSNHQKNYKSNPKPRAMGEGLELLGLCKDGEEIPIEISLGPVETHEGLMVTAAIRDITKRKLAEEKLQASERSLAEAQRIAHLGHWEWNIPENKISWPDEVFRIFGFLPQQFEVTYDLFLDTIHPEDHRKVKNAVNKVLADPTESYQVQHRIIRKDKTERIVEEQGKVKFDNDGKPFQMIGTVNDLTELKKAEVETKRLRTELEHVNRVGTLDALASTLAHEINQPLAAILSNAQAAIRFLNNDQPDIKEVRDALKDIVKDDKRAGEIIRQIRGLVKKGEPINKQYKLNRIIKNVLKLIHSEIVIDEITLTTDLDSGIRILSGDSTQMQQVILNILLNAIEAVKEQPADIRSIKISTKADGENGVLISITDTGPGIREDKIEKIFDSFHTTKSEGLGLGLSLCQSIVESSRGNLKAENSPEGGAKFTIWLPYKKKGDNS